MDLPPIVDRVLAGERISPDEAWTLHEEADLATLAYLADEVRLRKHPEGVVSYIVDRNLNPTNVCVTDCGFCAFYAKPSDKAKSYVLDRETIYAKIQETVDVGGIQILMQGGHHPQLDVEWFEELLRDIKARWPELHMHAMSPPEIEHLSKVSKIPTLEVLRRLQAAGMDSLPGGGAEILTEAVREKIAPRKTDTDTWLRIMEEAHSLGMRTTATMMFGHVETLEERIEHLERLRKLQDKTQGFTAFIAWGFQPGNTQLQGDSGIKTAVTGFEYLKTLAISRIFLDNFSNLQSSWVTQGPKIGQVSLYYGANDMGSTMMEENVVAAAGTVYCMDEEEIRRLITDGGFIPQRRNMKYDYLPH